MLTLKEIKPDDPEYYKPLNVLIEDLGHATPAKVYGDVIVTVEDLTDALHYLQEYKQKQDMESASPDYYELVNFWAESQENRPLTMEDLCHLEMIGEPVWNSNTLRWMMLLIDNASDGTWIELINHAGGHEKWIEHDVRKFPLYRMRGAG